MAIIGRGGHYRQLIMEGCNPEANLVAIGHCGDREKEVAANGGKWDKFVSPRAALYVKSDQIGEGSQVMSGAVVYAPLGKHCIVGTNAVVSHDAICEDFVFIGPGAIVTGYVKLGRGCFIGAGAVVTPRSVVPPGMMLKAGARLTTKHHGMQYTKPERSLVHPPARGTI